MTDWWTVGYPGGPMVQVPGFPRSLYPPVAAAKGRQPSIDGPDVEAYKRTVSRAQRWPWQEFDQSYSNAFALGRGSNVGESGVAGVQRQQHIDATGWLGEKTFNTLRSILIPIGPNKGQHAMDALASALIAEAWELFGGNEPPLPDRFSPREIMLDRAITKLGYREGTGEYARFGTGSNMNMFGDWYGMNGVPWCAIFVTWASLTSGTPIAAFVKGSRYAYVPYIVGDARAGRYGMHTTDDPIPGDLVCYDWNWNGEYDHIGIFESWTAAKTWSAIEGNTSYGSNSNGGEVMRRSRTLGEQATVFVRLGL